MRLVARGREAQTFCRKISGVNWRLKSAMMQPNYVESGVLAYMGNTTLGMFRANIQVISAHPLNRAASYRLDRSSRNIISTR